MKNKWLIRSAVLLGVCMAALLVTTPLMAAWSWCDVDPILSINGHEVHWQAFVLGDPALIVGKVEFDITAYKGTDVKVLYVDSYFKTKVKVIYKVDMSPGEVLLSFNFTTAKTYDLNVVVSVDGVEKFNEVGTTKSEPSCTLFLLP